jgi:hypothetical protein
MFYRLLPVAFLISACAGPGGAPDVSPSRFASVGVQHPAVSSVERYDVAIPMREALGYKGSYAAEFAHGLPLAPGSGLAFKSMEADGALVFWSLGDRGPNGDSPKVDVNGAKSDTKIFLTPDFVPRLAEIRVERGQRAYVARTLALTQDGRPMSGLPLPPGQTGATGEVPLDDRLATLPFSTQGIDPEGVAIDAQGSLWIVDEYGPFLTQVDAQSGAIVRKLAPGKGLPVELGARQPNRGFEGVAVTPAGKVYAAVQSTLDIDGKTRASARFTRIVEFDPKSGSVRQLAYPIDVDDYKKAGDAKIGDLVAFSDTRLLLIEQGKDKHGTMRNIVYALDVSGADDLGAVRTPAGKPMEFATADEVRALRMIRKRKVLDLREIGWSAEKAEGLAIVDGGLAVINDNDFGLATEVDGDHGGDPGLYTIDAGRLSGHGRLRVKANDEATQLWLLRLKQPLVSFFPG